MQHEDLSSKSRRGRTDADRTRRRTSREETTSFSRPISIRAALFDRSGNWFEVLNCPFFFSFLFFFFSFQSNRIENLCSSVDTVGRKWRAAEDPFRAERESVVKYLFEGVNRLNALGTVELCRNLFPSTLVLRRTRTRFRLRSRSTRLDQGDVFVHLCTFFGQRCLFVFVIPADDKKKKKNNYEGSFQEGGWYVHLLPEEKSLVRKSFWQNPLHNVRRSFHQVKEILILMNA